MTAATAKAISSTSASRPSAVGHQLHEGRAEGGFGRERDHGVGGEHAVRAPAAHRSWRRAIRGPRRYQARMVVPPGASTACDSAPREQLHQFFGNRRAAEAGGPRGVEHHQVAALEAAREIRRE